MRLWCFALLASLSMSTWACPDTLDFTFRKLASKDEIKLCEAYQDKVLLVVNVASKCGFTPQYEGLEKLYEEYGDRGLAVLGFPSNDFMGQEPGTEEEIQDFCRTTYGVQFPMHEKVTVVGDDAHPFYQKLAAETDGLPRWNFHKYLIDRDGNIVRSFGSRTKPYDDELISAIKAAL